MEDQQEIGGAQALLLLGTKDSKSDDSEHHEHHSDHEQSETVHANSDDVSDMLEEKENQQLNDAVEAAVMRYVGGTLEGDNHSLHNGTGSENDNGAVVHDVNVLDVVSDELGEDSSGHLGQKRRMNHEVIIPNISDYQWDRFLEEDVAADFERASPKRKRRKSYGGGSDIDPELAGLDSTSEHDQLVHAAILGAGELANQLSIPSRPIHALNVHRRGGENEPSAINQLANAAALSSGLKGQVEQRRPLKKYSDTYESPILPRPKYDPSSLESLVEQAASESCMWYNSHAESGMGGPRPFSREEIQIMENFVDGYCRLNDLTRMDICRRVWSNERTKDNFWESLTKVLPYRSRASVYKHVRRQYHVFDIRARWTPEEDELLKKLAVTCKTNWKKLGEIMNRMPEDCRDRWRNYVKCGDNRASNKWSEQEETALREIVMEMLTDESANKGKPILINWTLVSERMNGLRSRIQCRYKWNKLLRRESRSRVAMMDTDTKLWLANRIMESNFADIDSIDWVYILHLYHEEHKGEPEVLWTLSDFKVGFEKMKSLVRDNKNLPLHTLLSKLIASLYELTSGEAKKNDKSIPYDLEPKRERPTEDEMEAASVANAAVAAVSSGATEQESQHQEYSLWR